jgi:hypothetical protein
MNIEKMSIIPEAQGNDIRLTVIAHTQSADAAAPDDGVDGFPVGDLPVFSSHAASPPDLKLRIAAL